MSQRASEPDDLKQFFSEITNDLWNDYNITLNQILCLSHQFGDLAELVQKLARQFKSLTYSLGSFSANDVVIRLTEDPAIVTSLISACYFECSRSDALTMMECVVTSPRLTEERKLEPLRQNLFKTLLNDPDLDLLSLKLIVKNIRSMITYARTDAFCKEVGNTIFPDLQKLLDKVKINVEDEELVIDTSDLMVEIILFLNEDRMTLYFTKRKYFHQAVEIVTSLHKQCSEEFKLRTIRIILKTISRNLLPLIESAVKGKSKGGGLMKSTVTNSFCEIVRQVIPLAADYMKHILQVVKKADGKESSFIMDFMSSDWETVKTFDNVRLILWDFFLYGDGLKSDYSYLLRNDVITTALAIYNRTDGVLKETAHQIVRDFVDLVCFPDHNTFPGKNKILPTLQQVINNKKLLKEEIYKTVNGYCPKEILAINCLCYIADHEKGGLSPYDKIYVKALVKYNVVGTIYDFATNNADNLGYVSTAATCFASFMGSADFGQARAIVEQVLPCIPFFLEFLTKPSVYKRNEELTVEITKISVNIVPKSSENDLVIDTILTKIGLFSILTELMENIITVRTPLCAIYCLQIAKIVGNLCNIAIGRRKILAENMIELLPIMWKVMDSPYLHPSAYMIVIHLTKVLTPYVFHKINDTNPAEILLMEIYARLWIGGPPQWTVCTVPFAWCIARRGKKSKMYDHLCQISVKKFGKAKTESALESEHAKIFKLLVSIVIETVEKPTTQSMTTIRKITEGFIHIAENSKSDEEIYALEDLVPPFMWMLERYDDPAIITNVKEFINIMH